MWTKMRVRGLASCAALRKRRCIPKHLCSTQSSGFSIQPSVIGDTWRWLHVRSHDTGEEWVELWGVSLGALKVLSHLTLTTINVIIISFHRAMCSTQNFSD